MRVALPAFAVLSASFFFLVNALFGRTAPVIWLWSWAFTNPVLALSLVPLSFVGFLLLYRQWLQHGGLAGRLFPSRALRRDTHGFPWREVDLFAQLEQRPAGLLFVGMKPVRRRWLPGWKWVLCAATHNQQAFARHASR